MTMVGVTLVVLSCGDGAVKPASPPVPVATTVAVNPASATLASFGETTRFTAEVRDQNGQVMSGAAVAWTSSDASVAAVDASGQVTAAANGSATITATTGTVSGTAAVTVAQVVSAVAVSPATAILVAFGDTVRLVAEASDANGHSVDALVEFEWSSSDTLVARVDASGLVESLAEGAALVTATASDVTGGAELTVVPPLPTAIAVSPDTIRLTALGQTAQLVAEVREQAGRVMAEASVTWSSGDTLVVAVDSTGLVRAVGWGTTTVTAATGDVSGAVAVTVMQLSDREILEIFYEVTGGPEWTRSDNWLTDAPLRGWYGVEVDGAGRVSSLALYRNNLTGSIPPELGDLANLANLYLSGNGLTDRIPPALGDLTNLYYLWLSENELTGPIPSRLGGLANLQLLALSANGLTGLIPPELGNLANLVWLYLGRNELTASLPPEIGGLTRLQILALQANPDMRGALPASLTNLGSLEILEASGTQLCARSDPSFLEWLDRLASPRVVLCEGRPPASAYLVQAVQSRDFPVPLVAGEEALLRVFVTAGRDNSESLPPVRASFHLNGALVHVADIPAGGGPIPTEVDESSLLKSANAVIPPEVVRPGLEMVVEIDPDGTLDPALGVPQRIPASGRLTVDVSGMPVFDLTLVPFLWTKAPDSAILESVAETGADPEYMLWGRAPYLPVGELEVRAHEPVLSSSNNTSDLLVQTRVIRAMEGGTGYYMGTMSRPVTGTGGIAFVGGKVSFSLIPGPTAHELGHNFNLDHAPCGGAPGPDPAYPYEGAEIGVWGYDPRDGGTLVAPTTTDIMSYCGGWISDYHYTIALRHRVRHDGTESTASVASLLLWGGIDDVGLPRLEPAFVVDAPPALPDSAGAYRITGRTASGAELFSYSFTMPATAYGDGSSGFAFALPVRAGWEDVLATITLSGLGGTVTLDGESDIPMAILRDPRTGQVRGILRDMPAATEVAADGVGATTTGLEVVFSRGIPDPEAWRR